MCNQSIHSCKVYASTLMLCISQEHRKFYMVKKTVSLLRWNVLNWYFLCGHVFIALIHCERAGFVQDLFKVMCIHACMLRTSFCFSVSVCIQRDSNGYRAKPLAELNMEEVCQWFSNIGLQKCLPFIRGKVQFAHLFLSYFPTLFKCLNSPNILSDKCIAANQ